MGVLSSAPIARTDPGPARGKGLFALISDIHSNIEALNAVLEDLEGLGVEEIVCLGDVIGYGPNPRETLEAVRRCRFCLLGNHEEGLLNLESAVDFNERARRALEWTSAQLLSPDHPKEENYALWDFIDAFEEERVENDFHFVHASPRQPVREYVLPADALDRFKMKDIFEHIQGRVAFGGHTHVPGIFVRGRTFRYQGDLEGKQTFPEEKCLINIGSVGQPRDGDNRACYLVVDGDVFFWRRVSYDIATTMRKIKRIPELDDFLANRLKGGK